MRLAYSCYKSHQEENKKTEAKRKQLVITEGHKTYKKITEDNKKDWRLHAKT